MVQHPLLAYARDLIARASQGGWRPLVGWGGAFLFGGAFHFALVDAPRAGIALSGDYYTFLNVAFGLYVTTFLARGVEKAIEQRAGTPYARGPGAEAGAA